MKVGYATDDWGWHNGRRVLGGSAWWRCMIPAQWLADHGGTVVTGRPVGHPEGDRLGVAEDGDLDRCAFDLDLVVLHRVMDHRVPEAVRKARQAGQVIVNDVDDWYWGLRPSNQAFAASSAKTNPDENRDHYRRVIAASDMVTVSTPYLAERISRYNPSVTVLRNAIDLHRWHAKQASDGPPTVGWVGAVPWRSGDLETLQGIIGPFMMKQGCAWYHGGHIDGVTPAAELAGVPESVPQSTKPMLPIEDYPSLYEPLDIGLVPLSDIPFNRAKSSIKGQECAAAGVPFVAAGLPEYEELAFRGIGRTARKPKHWLRHLTELLDPGVRAQEAKRNRQRLEPLSIQARGYEWLDCYHRLLDSV